MAALATLANMPGLTDFLGEDLKITFDNYSSFDVPMIDGLVGRPVTVELPSTITVGQLAIIQIENNASGLTLLDLNISATFYGLISFDLLKLTMGLSSTTASAIDVNVDIQKGLHDMLGLAGAVGVNVSLPNLDYRLSVDISKIDQKIFPMSLVSFTDDDARTETNMGDATISMDFSKPFPINYINVTSYANNTATAWNKMWFDLNQTEENVVLTIDNSSWKDNEGVWEDSTHVSTTTVTMTEYVNATNAQVAVQSVVSRAVTELATTGVASRYEMEIETETQGVTVRVMDVTVTPSIEGTNAVATINVQPYKSGAASTPIDIVATADLAGSNVIAVDVVMGETTVGSAYFTSNIAGIVTDNEDIQLANVEVTPVKDGIYVSGTTAASYRIVSMSGATVANGTVSGDNAYISTSALAKGIYVIVVTENGESKAIKFAR